MAAYPIASGQDKKKESRRSFENMSGGFSDKKGEEHKSCIPAVVLKSDTFYGYGHARERRTKLPLGRAEGVDPILFDPDSASFSGSTFLSLSVFSQQHRGEESYS